MAYTHTKWSEAKNLLAEKLQDPGKVFWKDAELGFYLGEALRTWQSLTWYWKERTTFNTIANQPFYDLPAYCSNLAYTIKDQNLITELEYQLLEPPTAAWTGTEMFTLTDLTNALQQARNRLILETGCTATRQLIVPDSLPASRLVMNDSTVAVKRVVWTDVDDNHNTLWQVEEMALTNYFGPWTTNYEIPIAFSVSASPLLTVQLAPVLNDTGVMDIITTSTPVALDPAVGILMNIPDNFCWVAKFGALALLLSKDGPAQDPLRADYCKKRYEQGMQILISYPSFVQVELQGIPLIAATLEDMDSYNGEWQNTRNAPQFICTEGLNLVALVPVPDGIYSVTMDTVKNAPVPSDDNEYLQLGRELLQPILDYALHLAMFKISGEEWKTTIPAWEGLINLAKSYNEKALILDDLLKIGGQEIWH